MKPKKRLTALVLVLVLVTGTASLQAQILPDPATPGLQAVLVWCDTFMQRALTVFDAAQVKFYNIVRWVKYPERMYQPITRLFAVVRGIKHELVELSCSIQLPGRVGPLWDQLTRPVKICTPTLQQIFGSDVAFANRDISELHDRVSTLNANLVEERVNSEWESWDRIFTDQLYASAMQRKSPGESERDIAANVAWHTQVEMSNTRLSAQALATEDLRWQARRARKRSEQALAAMLWRANAGEDPFGGSADGGAQ